MLYFICKCDFAIFWKVKSICQNRDFNIVHARYLVLYPIPMTQIFVAKLHEMKSTLFKVNFLMNDIFNDIIIKMSNQSDSSLH